MSAEGNALVAKGDSGERSLMMPPPPRAHVTKRKPAVVLDEDEWTLNLERIIERDYFPDLPKLQMRLEWLEAQRTGDPEKIRRARDSIEARLSTMRRPTSMMRTPSSFETPGATPAVNATPKAFETPLTGNMRSNPDADVDSTPGLGARGTPSARTPRDQSGDIASTSGRDNAEGRAPTMSLDNFCARYTSEDNASFDGIVAKMNERKLNRGKWMLEQAGKSPKQDGTSEQPTNLEFNYDKAKNLLYYDSSYQPLVPYTTKELDAMAKGAPKEIKSVNTRFTGTPNTHGESNGGPENASTTSTPSRPEQATPYRYMQTPTIEPGVDESPFITWGKIDSTPLRLDPEETPIDIGGDAKTPAFGIQPTTVRERVNRKLAQSASQAIASRRDGPRKLGTLPSPSPLRKTPGSSQKQRPVTPGTPAGRVQLSDAARKLVSASRGGNAMDAQLRASYNLSTPTRTPSKSTPQVNHP